MAKSTKKLTKGKKQEKITTLKMGHSPIDLKGGGGGGPAGRVGRPNLP